MNRLIKRSALFFCVVAVCALTSCYPVKQYQSNLVGMVPPVPKFTGKVPLAFVEFDDNGEIFSRAQLTNTISEITKMRGNCQDGYVILFIHGWKNNADSNSGNVAGFEDFLRDFYNEVNGSMPSCQEPVMGIYIGWRGARIKVAQDLSYYNGTNAAVRAGGPDLEETLFKIMCEARPRQGNTKLNLIMIGHSFGGRVLEKVMTPYLETQILDTTRSGGYVSNRPIEFPLPSLMVLLNEAAPATDAKQFLEFLKVHKVEYGYRNDGESSVSKPVPLFLSITSDGDYANHIFLPIGQTGGRIWMKTRAYCTGDPAKDKQSHCSGDPADPGSIPNQSTYFTHTTASIPALYSHYFASGSAEVPPQCNKNTGDKAVATWSAGSGQAKPYLFCEAAPDVKWNHTPYWVSSLPVSIVPDHSDIFQKALSDTLIQWIHGQLLTQGKQPILTANN